MAYQRSIRVWFIVLFGLLLSVSGGWGAPITPERAQRVVENWLAQDPQPLKTPLGQRVKNVQTFADEAGNPSYHVVYLDPAGLVFVPGDDLVEPIIGFSTAHVYDSSPANPAGALVSRDIPRRVTRARQREAQARDQGLDFAPQGDLEAAQRKWAILDPNTESAMGRLPVVSDPRVEPLIKTWWGQGDVKGVHVYNYYTHWKDPEDPTKEFYFAAGCNAVAMGQLMRYHQHPATGVGTGAYRISIQTTGAPKYFDEPLRGGDSSGGPYRWDLMVADPLGMGITEEQARAIGALTHDAGVAAHQDYTSTKGAGTATSLSGKALKETFGYGNYIAGWGRGASIVLDKLYLMVNPNLDAKLPVILGINGPDVSHVVLCDGYGYQTDGATSTPYHHLNMGWQYVGDYWYNLPNIDTPEPNKPYNAINDCIYNIFLSGAGEIVSGRILGSACQAPVEGVRVTATRTPGGETFSASTDYNGIYGLTNLPSNSTFTIRPSKAGYAFSDTTVTTGKSVNDGDPGNCWGVNFVLGQGPAVVEYKLFSLAKTGTSSRAFAINNKGQIVGAAKTDNAGVFTFHATYWPKPQEADLKMFDLGTIGGYESEAHDINDDGLLVGWAQYSGSANKYPCFYNPIDGRLEAIPTEGNRPGQALGINHRGEVVGFSYFSYTSQGPIPAYWKTISTQCIPLQSWWQWTGQVNRINNLGVAVGQSFNSGARWRANAWSGANLGTIISLDYDTEKSDYSDALGVSNQDPPYIVGNYTPSTGNKTAAIFHKGDIILLGSLGGKTSTAYGINSRGQVVGQATNCNGRGRAFIWDSVNGIRDLNNLVDAPDWILNTAYDINEQGEIVGWGYYNGIFDFAFLLRPSNRPGNNAPIMELLLFD
jgi:probable HAF family extracellular repeat protein